MANSITLIKRLDGERKIVLEYQILGDGSGEETDTVLVDFSTLAQPSRCPATNFAIQKFVWQLTGFSATLNWDATANVQALALPEGSDGYDYTGVGSPLVNTAGAGVTGDLLITTVGLGAGDTGTIIIEGIKRQ